MCNYCESGIQGCGALERLNFSWHGTGKWAAAYPGVVAAVSFCAFFTSELVNCLFFCYPWYITCFCEQDVFLLDNNYTTFSYSELSKFSNCKQNINRNSMFCWVHCTICMICLQLADAIYPEEVENVAISLARPLLFEQWGGCQEYCELAGKPEDQVRQLL